MMHPTEYAVGRAVSLHGLARRCRLWLQSACARCKRLDRPLSLLLSKAQPRPLSLSLSLSLVRSAIVLLFVSNASAISIAPQTIDTGTPNLTTAVMLTTPDATNTRWTAWTELGSAPVWCELGVTSGVISASTPNAIPLTISEKTWQKLSPADRDAVTKAGREVADWIRKEIVANEDRQLQEMQSKGAKVHRPDPAPFRKAVESVYSRAKEKYGADLDAIVADAEAIRKAVPAR